MTLVSATGAHYTAGVRIDVANRPALKHGGDGEIWWSTRLQWLNSKVGLGEHPLPPPFTPAELDAQTVSILGKSVVIGADGMLWRVVRIGAPRRGPPGARFADEV